MTADTVHLGGCAATRTRWGGLTVLELDGLSMLQYPADEAECGSAGVWLRLLDGPDAEPIRVADPAATRLVTPYSDGFEVAGAERGLAFRCRFSLHPQEMLWQWSVRVENVGSEAKEIDAVMAVDVALAPADIVRINQFYVSQYLDLTPLQHAGRGTMLAVRQNMPGPRSPWVLLGSHGTGVSWATDAAQLTPVADGVLTGLRQRRLPNRRLQNEHTLAVLADHPVTLQPGDTHRTGFFGRLVTDHPRATSAADIVHAPPAPLQADPTPTGPPESSPPATLFATSPEVRSRPIEPTELLDVLDGQPQVVERHGNTWWEAVTPAGEVLVSAAKQQVVQRPHGHLLRTGSSSTPDPDSLTATVWMDGCFASHLTRGHVGRDPLLTAVRGHLGLQRSQGLRIFVRDQGPWRLLGRPSAWGLRPDRARWWYAWPDTVLQVTTTAGTDHHALGIDLRVLHGHDVDVLVVAQLPDEVRTRLDPFVASGAGGSLRLDAGSSAVISSDGPLFVDGDSRGLPFVSVAATSPLQLTLSVAPPEATSGGAASAPPSRTVGGSWQQRRRSLGLELDQHSAASGEVRRLDSILPWFTHNALVHYLSPRGLEQFSGGAWGTRDVCQGPVGLLTAFAEHDALRDLLLRVLGAQHDRGDWPQAFEFLPPLSVGQPEAHGDVLFWPVQAVGEYLLRRRDGSLLDESLPFVTDTGSTLPATVLEHLGRALSAIESRTVPGVPLPAYGHGDWNESLQPADPRLAAQMASTWTSVLQVQTLHALADGLDAVTAAPSLVARARHLAQATERAITALLLVDDVLAGYGVFDQQGTLEELLVHPRDHRTGLHYGVLPWIHAISADVLTPRSARHHLRAIEQHLLGPDGARLFDTPPPYRGGPMKVFQRAEAATFWGREIGLMYTHAHLRYAEALARVGDAEGLFRALCLVNPIGVTDRVRGGSPRQSTCYYSSSDAAFADRYDAAEHYPRSLQGKVALNGGWRVYSSGPGLFLRLLVECLLGVRLRGDELELDPVLALDLDGLTARVPLADRSLAIEYRVTTPGFGVRRVTQAGRALPTRPVANRYRPAGVRLSLADLDGAASIVVEVGDA